MSALFPENPNQRQYGPYLMIKKTKIVCEFVSFHLPTETYVVKFHDGSTNLFKQNEVEKIPPHEFLKFWGKQ